MGIFKFLMVIFVIYLIYSLVKNIFGSGSKLTGRDSSSGVISEMVQDPYCKTYIPRNEAYRAIVNGEEILFCSKECAEKYKDKRKS